MRCSPAEVGPDLECRRRLRQDSVFLFRVRSQIFGKNRTRCHFSISAVEGVCSVFSWVKTRKLRLGRLLQPESEQESDSQIWKIAGTAFKNFGTGAESEKVIPSTSAVLIRPILVSVLSVLSAAEDSKFDKCALHLGLTPLLRARGSGAPFEAWSFCCHEYVSQAKKGASY